MKQNTSRPREKDAAEGYWDELRAQGNLRAAVERQTAQIPTPDWEAVYRSGNGPQGGRRGLAPWSLVLGAAAACFVVAVFSVAPTVLERHEWDDASVVDQVFRSTAGGDSWEAAADRTGSTSFSSILKTIDAGFSRWDDAPALKE